MNTKYYLYSSKVIKCKLFLTDQSSPKDMPDRCFYYAPDYNVERFETAQGNFNENLFIIEVG